MIRTDFSKGIDYEKKNSLFIKEKHFKGEKLDADAINATAKLEWQHFRIISEKGQELRSCGYISEGKIFQWC
jgi:hypothetical protein